MSEHTSPFDPLIGRTFSQYEIVAKLGGGGMGVVYKARDTRLGRPVALKFLPAQWSHDDAAKQRFVREAQAASATNHRNICVVHNIEESTDGRLFIVMAYYEGQTLKHRLQSGPLPIADAIDIAIEIAEGLAKAHQQGVVHRDIKPGNLMVTDDGVKILDFGLAKFADTLQLTAPGTTIGTYAYMSPEQTRGEDADERSDVWALGIVLFEMLTGAPPFRGTYPEATFHAIKNEPLPAVRAVRPDVPEALEHILGRMLEKNNAARYQTAREVARDLRVLAGRTVPLELRTEAVSASERRAHDWSPPRTGRRRWRWVAAASCLLLAAAGAWYWWQFRPIERVRVAIAPVANHTGVVALDQYRLSLTATLIDALDESPNIRVVPFLRTLEMVRAFQGSSSDIAGAEAVHAVAARSGAPFVVVPTLTYRDRDGSWSMQVQIRNANTGTTVSTYETAPVASTLSEQAAFRLVADAATEVQTHFKNTTNGRAFRPRPAGLGFRQPDAARLYADGLRAYEQLEYNRAWDAFTASAGVDAQHAMTYAWISRVAWLLGARSEAADAAQRARQLLPPETPRREAAFVNAVVIETSGDMAAAEQAYVALTDVDKDDPWARIELADFLKRRQDRNQEAVEAYHAALTKDPTFIRPHIDLCQLYARIDDHPLVSREAQLALEGFAALADHSGEAQALLCLAEDQRKQAGPELEKARDNIARAQQIFASLDQPFNLARSKFYAGLVDYAAGRMADASAGFEESAVRLGATRNRPLQGVALMNLGAISFQVGEPTRALDFFKRGRQVFLDIGDERRAAEANTNAGGVMVENGEDPADALRTVGNARSTLERLGYLEFELLATLNEAEAMRYVGRLSRARTLLQAAYERARGRGLSDAMDSLALAMAQADIQEGRYHEARAALEQLHASGSAAIEARIALGIVLTRLGEFERADETLRQAIADLESGQYFSLRPMAHLARGRLAADAGNPTLGREQYDAAVSGWRDPLPNAYAIEAHCQRAVDDVSRSRFGAARADLEQGIVQSVRLGRLSVTGRCRLGLARLDLAERKVDEALKVFAGIPDDTADVVIERELRAEIEYWRGVALNASDPAQSAARISRARELLASIEQPLSAEERVQFEARTALRPIFQTTQVPGGGFDGR